MTDLNENFNGSDIPNEKASQGNVNEASSKEKKTGKKFAKELEALKAEVLNVKKQYEEVNDKYLRMLAEYDNYRRRTTKEKEALYGDTVCDVIKAMLPVLDNLERASSYENNPESAEGVSMILKSFIDCLSSFGVTEIEALGAQFDPNLHNAVTHIDDEKYGENEIYNVLQKGYIKGDKVIRHALVMVAN